MNNLKNNISKLNKTCAAFFPAFFALLILAVFVLGSCSSAPKVTRKSAEEQIDLSGYWNDSDVRIVCKSLIAECLNSPRVDSAIAENRRARGKLPMVLVGNFFNDSSEHLDTTIISGFMENAIFNSGKMDFVANNRVREQLRAERQDQQTNASVETAAKLGREIGANYLMTGSVKTIVDRIENKMTRTYFVTAELTNIETNQRMWMGQNSEIKKLIIRPKAKL